MMTHKALAIIERIGFDRATIDPCANVSASKYKVYCVGLKLAA
jgi:hypothetical protein